VTSVVLEAITKAYDGVETVHGIDLDIADGEFLVLVGPSGCGKSTTLRMIAGLETVTSGEIRIDDRRINELQPGERDIAMVFQNYALYPHLSVADNISFGLKLRKVPKPEIKRRLQETADVLEIGQLLHRKPRQLSGGQRQRVAMGRALIRNPKVFLFDEPLSNLDAKLRVQMRTEIKQLHARIPTTTVYVTHDQVEAMTLADRVVVMNGGRIEQIARPEELYFSPATKFVAGFVGAPGMNFVAATIAEQSGIPIASIERGLQLSLAGPRAKAYLRYAGKAVLLGIRPENFSFARSEDGEGTLQVALDLVEPLGMETLAHFNLAGQQMVARLPADYHLVSGSMIKLRVDSAKVHLIDPDSEKVIY
jgi:multiple sugar transport system ATP-binding protein